MLNIYERINAVRLKVEYIKKDKAVQNYKAVTHDQVTALTRDYLLVRLMNLMRICSRWNRNTGKYDFIRSRHENRTFKG